MIGISYYSYVLGEIAGCHGIAGELGFKYQRHEKNLSLLDSSSDGLPVDRFVRPSDAEYPELNFFVQYHQNEIMYGANSHPFDRRYHRHVSPPREQNPDEIRKFLGNYMNEVKCLQDMPRAEQS